MDAVCSRLRIGRRFRGPPGAANGGFASGSLAALLGGAVDVEVSLRRSVPLEHPLEVRQDRDAALLLDDHGCLLAQARPPAAEVEPTVPDTPTPVAAVEAAAVPAGTPVLLGLRLPGGIPVEEVLFFLVVPLCAVLALEAVRKVTGWDAGYPVDDA